MMRLVIDLKNEEDMCFVKELLERLHIDVRINESEAGSDTQAAVDALERIARRGEMGKNIPDPSAWQQDLQNDRTLPFRD
jgi:hypothetical protein